MTSWMNQQVSEWVKDDYQINNEQEQWRIAHVLNHWMIESVCDFIWLWILVREKEHVQYSWCLIFIFAIFIVSLSIILEVCVGCFSIIYYVVMWYSLGKYDIVWKKIEIEILICSPTVVLFLLINFIQPSRNEQSTKSSFILFHWSRIPKIQLSRNEPCYLLSNQVLKYQINHFSIFSGI